MALGNIHDLAILWGSAGRKTFRLKLFNTMNYAGYLHFKDGYFVFSESHLSTNVQAWFLKVGNVRPFTPALVSDTMEAIAHTEINWLRSKTGKTSPPVKMSGAIRQQHPGGWADVTGQLASNYKAHLNGKGLSFGPQWPGPS